MLPRSLTRHKTTFSVILAHVRYGEVFKAYLQVLMANWQQCRSACNASLACCEEFN